jgi:hypothetical protein
MNEAFAVEKNQRIEHRSQHFANLGFRERPLRENLRKIFFGILHHDIETIPVLEPPAASLEDAKQVWMFELLGAAPHRELVIGVGTGGNEFNGRSLRLRIDELRDENGRVVRASKVLPKPESIVDHLAFALIPEFAHVAPPAESTCEPAGGDTSNSAVCDRRKRNAASKAGLERLDLRFAGARGRALVTHILARNKLEGE